MDSRGLCGAALVVATAAQATYHTEFSWVVGISQAIAKQRRSGRPTTGNPHMVD
jgi:hypothetical protein